MNLQSVGSEYDLFSFVLVYAILMAFSLSLGDDNDEDQRPRRAKRDASGETKTGTHQPKEMEQNTDKQLKLNKQTNKQN